MSAEPTVGPDPRGRRQPRRPGAAGPVPRRRGPRGDRGRQRRARARAPARRRPRRSTSSSSTSSCPGWTASRRSRRSRATPALAAAAGHRDQRPRRARLGRPLHRDRRRRLSPAPVPAGPPAGPDHGVARREAPARRRARAPRAADRHERGAQGHRPLGVRPPGRPRCDRRDGGASRPGRLRRDLPRRRRALPGSCRVRGLGDRGGRLGARPPAHAGSRHAHRPDHAQRQVEQILDVLADPEYEWHAQRDDRLPEPARRADP